MSHAFWSNPPWANGNGGHQMLLKPLAVSDWCPQLITASEKDSKRALLARHFPAVVQTIEGSENAQVLLAKAISERYPLSDPTDIGLPPNTQVATLKAKTLIASALTVPEDLCLMQKGPDGYQLVAACVCAPSYWRLPEKIGLNLSQIHAPVPGLNDSLADRMGEFFNKLPAGRVFTRRNWLIHASSERFQPTPEELAQIHNSEQANALVVRSETQTLRRLSDLVVVFTIKIECHSLADISSHPQAASQLKQALLSRNRQEREAADQEKYHEAVLLLLDSVIG